MGKVFMFGGRREVGWGGGGGGGGEWLKGGGIQTNIELLMSSNLPSYVHHMN
jgi:hypothetical protein